MPAFERTIFVNAPLEKVFAFMAEPYSLLEILPGLHEIRDVEPLPNGGFCYGWSFKMAGLRLNGQAEWTGFVKDQQIVIKNAGDIPSTLTWSYRAENVGARVSVVVDYTIPGVVHARLTEPVIQKMNEHEGEAMLANLKARMEG